MDILGTTYNDWVVVEPPLLKIMKVSRDDYSQHVGKECSKLPTRMIYHEYIAMVERLKRKLEIRISLSPW